MTGQHKRGRGRIVAAVTAAVGLCLTAGLPGQAMAAGEANPYVFAEEAQKVAGAAGSTDARRLKAGTTYRSSIKPGGKLYYSVDLDGKSGAYISAVAVPKLKAKVAYADGLTVTLQDRAGATCSSEEAGFSSNEYPRPLTAHAERIIQKDSTDCQKADTYYVYVERTTEGTSAQEPWDLELRFSEEPAVSAGEPTEAPEEWASASPVPPVGEPQRRKGGTGFNDAVSLDDGSWKSRIEPGQTLFYRVPVDWGQQLFVDTELGSAAPKSTDSAYVPGALNVALNNPARSPITSVDTVFDGDPATAVFDPLSPVAYENRYASDEDQAAMRFAGWYYIKVTMNPAMAKGYGDKPFGLTLRVNVKGEPKKGPAYAGDPGAFQVTDDDRSAAGSGKSAAAVARSESMQVVAYAGIGAGTVLLLALGAWTLIARRGAANTAGGPAAPTAPVPPQGYPAGSQDHTPPSQFGQSRGW